MSILGNDFSKGNVMCAQKKKAYVTVVLFPDFFAGLPLLFLTPSAFDSSLSTLVALLS